MSAFVIFLGSGAEATLISSKVTIGGRDAIRAAPYQRYSSGPERGVSDAVPAAVDAQALMALGVALDRLGAGGVRGLVGVALLARAFPQWTV